MAFTSAGRAPLIGREAELARLSAVVHGNAAPGAVVTGPLGVGKSRLASEVLARVEDAEIERIAASRGLARIPFGAFAHVLAGRLTLDETSLAGPEGMATLLQEAGGVFGGAGTAILLVDDAHALDEGSGALVEHLAVSGACKVVATIRSDEPVLEHLVRLWSDRGFERVELGPLSRDDTEALAEEVVGAPLGPRARADLWRLSQGNPLYVRELLTAAVERGDLVDEDGLWRLVETLAVSDRLGEVVASRLTGLAGEELAALETLALSGRLPVTLLEKVSDLEAVESLEERDLVRVSDRRSRTDAELAHPVYEEVLRRRMPGTRRRRLSRSLADALEAVGTRRHDDLLRLATWRLDAGGPYDPELFTRAAQLALASFDHALAERLARVAVNAGAVTASLALGEALANQHRVDEAETVLGEAQERAETERERSQAALARAQLLFYRAGRMDEAMDLLEDVGGRVSDSDTRDQLDALLALFATMRGDIPRASALGERVLGRADAGPTAIVSTLVTSTVADALLGRLERAEIGIDRAVLLASEVREAMPVAADLLELNRVFVREFAGRFDEAENLARVGYQGALDLGAEDAAAIWAHFLGRELLHRGQLEEALRRHLEALTLLRRRDVVGILDGVLAFTGLVASQVGDSEQARSMIAEVDPVRRAHDTRIRAHVDWAELWALATEGEIERATAEARDRAAQAVDEGNLAVGAFILHGPVRWGRGEVALEALSEVASGFEGDLVSHMHRHAQALVDDDGARLLASSTAYESLGSPLWAAEAAAQAVAAFQAAGDPRKAAAASARAGALLARCPGARTPALSGVTEVPLTPREREVAALAARGTTSAEIAKRLVVSVRTVDNHLASVYRKLGVNGRDELGSVLGVGSAPD